MLEPRPQEKEEAPQGVRPRGLRGSTEGDRPNVYVTKSVKNFGAEKSLARRQTPAQTTIRTRNKLGEWRNGSAADSGSEG